MSDKIDMAKYPWMPLYTKDILASCSEMTDEEFGAYCRLLFTQWNNGSLNGSPNRLPIGLPNGESLDIVMAKFQTGEDGRLRNARLEVIRAEFVGVREAQSEGGRKGARKRWDSSPNDLPNGLPNANHNQSHNHNQKKSKKKKPEYSEEFNTFWKAYPRKIGKSKAWESWQSNNPPLEKCLETIRAFGNSIEWHDPKFIPHPTTWLNQSRWDDEPTQSGTQGREEYNFTK